MAGKGEFLGMDLFGNGQRMMAEFRIACLMVRRDGVVDGGLDAVFREILLKLVAAGTEHGENVVNAFGSC